MTSPTSQQASAILRIWYSTMPEWAQKAYHSCPTCKRVIKESALSEHTKEEMLWRLAGTLLNERDSYKEAVLKAAMEGKSV